MSLWQSAIKTCWSSFGVFPLGDRTMLQRSVNSLTPNLSLATKLGLLLFPSIGLTLDLIQLRGECALS